MIKHIGQIVSILILFVHTTHGQSQDIRELLTGDWVRYQYKYCDSTSYYTLEFPNQFEFSFNENAVNIRYRLDYAGSTQYQYERKNDTIDIVGNSKYRIIKISQSFLELEQYNGEVCFIHNFRRESEVLEEFKRAMSYQLYESDTFYLSNLSLYPQLQDRQRIYDLLVDKFKMKLKKAGIAEMEILIFLSGSSEVVNVDISGCDNPDLDFKIKEFLYKTSGQWQMPVTYKESLNMVYRVNYLEY